MSSTFLDKMKVIEMLKLWHLLLSNEKYVPTKMLKVGDVNSAKAIRLSSIITCSLGTKLVLYSREVINKKESKVLLEMTSTTLTHFECYKTV
jgi:hypothetical protein